MELTTKCTKIYPRENVTWGLMCENLAARKYLRSQYYKPLKTRRTFDEARTTLSIGTAPEG